MWSFAMNSSALEHVMELQPVEQTGLIGDLIGMLQRLDSCPRKEGGTLGSGAAEWRTEY